MQLLIKVILFISVFTLILESQQFSPINYVTSTIDLETRSLDYTKPVGTLKGKFSVSPNGSANYNIPIYTPSGTKTLVPQISLSYNSVSKNGTLGWGWGLMGLSAISRENLTYYLDGEVENFDLDDSDKLNYNGSRLIVKNSETYGSQNAVYAPEVGDEYEITPYGQSGSPKTGYDYFEVKKLDGTIIEFGKTTDSKQYLPNTNNVLSWYISRIQDKFSNFIEFSYFNHDGEIYIDEIKYTGNVSENLNPYNSIKFYYGIRNDKNFRYSKGEKIEKSLLLNKIEVESENQIVRTYEINYILEKFSKIYSIEEKNADNESYNNTLFEFDGRHLTNVPDIDVCITPYQLYDNGAYLFGDFSGNGITDKISNETLINNDDPKKWYYYESHNYLSGASNTGASITQQFQTQGNDALFEYSTVGDFNGDGRQDLITCRKNSNNNYDLEYHKSNGNSFSFTSNIHLVNTQLENVYSADFTGTGVDDLLVVTVNNGIRKATLYSLYDDSNKSMNIFFSKVENTPIEISDDVYVLNVDNDGKADILDNNLSRLSEYSIATNNKYDRTANSIQNEYIEDDWFVKFADFNGDGLTDLLYFKKDDGNEWKIRYGTGKKTGDFFTQEYNAPNFNTNNEYPFLNYNNNNYYVGDFNGDGKSDIVEYYKLGNPSNLHFDIYYSVGNNDFEKVTNTINHNHPDLGSYFCHQSNVNIGDFNGDGKDDLYISWGDSPDQVISFNPHEDLFHIGFIVNGKNDIIKVHNKPLTVNTIDYDKGNSASFPLYDVRNSLFVVSSTEFYNIDYFNQDPLSYKIYYYGYKEAVSHRQGKGLLGFKYFKEYRGNFVDENYFSFDNQYYYRQLDKKITYRLNGTSKDAVNMEEYLFDYIDLNNNRYFPFVENKTTTNPIFGHEIIEVNDYDLNANIEEQNIYYGSISSPVKSKKVEYTFENKDSWKPNYLTKKITTDRHEDSNDPIGHVRIEENEFDQNGILTSTIINRNHPKDLTKQVNNVIVERDGFGNVTNKLTFAPNDPTTSPLTTTRDYSDNGRYMEEKNDTEGNLKTFTYDIIADKVETASTYGITTTKNYDSWGNLTDIEHAEGELESFSTEWTTFPNSINSHYKIINTSNNSKDNTKYYDVWGNLIRSETTLFGGNIAIIDKEYDNKFNLLQAESLPYFNGDQIKWIKYDYDIYGRKKENRLTINADPLDDLATTFSYNGYTITESDPNGIITSKTSNVAGQIIEEVDDGGTIEYRYHDNGQISKIIYENTVETNFDYDIHKNKTEINDPNAGTYTYDYNAYDQLIEQVDPKGSIHTLTYDNFSRLETKTSNGTIYFSYFENGNKRNLLKEIQGADVHKTFDYNERKLFYTGELIDNGTVFFEKYYTYDSKGNIKSELFPSEFSLNYYYDSGGNLTSIKNGSDNSLIWELSETNANNAFTEYLYGNGVNNYRDYNNPYGYLSDIRAEEQTTLQNLHYEYDERKNVMISRTDIINNNQTEVFDYDNLYRLTNYTTNGVPKIVDYTLGGNIDDKSDVGDYQYNDPIRSHAITDLIPDPGDDACGDCLSQDITYNSYNDPINIKETGYSYDIVYDENQIRRATKMFLNGNWERTKYYIENYEKIIDQSGRTKQIHYIHARNKLVGAFIIEEDNGSKSEELFYIHTDHLGSIQTITDNQANVVATFSYDPWGKLREADNWNNNYDNEFDHPQFSLLERGFTGHEHIPEFGLINMNGRLYDPCLGRFLHVDNLLQNKGITQGLNRYSYALNNPLQYTDPDGDFVWAAIAAYVIFFTDPGYELQKFISPVAVKFNIGYGSFGWNMGFDVSIGLPTSLPIAYRLNFGMTYYTNYYGTGKGGTETRLGGQWSVSYFGIVVTVEGTQYNYSAGDNFNEFTRSTGTYSVGSPLILLNVKSENDENWFKYIFGINSLPGIPKADGGDRFLTSRTRIDFGIFSVGLDLFTGDPGLKWKDRRVGIGEDGNEYYLEGNTNPDKYRAGVLFLKVGPISFGLNSEDIRDEIQNQIIHKWQDVPFFRNLGSPNDFWFHFGVFY